MCDKLKVLTKQGGAKPDVILNVLYLFQCPALFDSTTNVFYSLQVPRHRLCEPVHHWQSPGPDGQHRHLHRGELCAVKGKVVHPHLNKYIFYVRELSIKTTFCLV